jgi:hypothetical protein
MNAIRRILRGPTSCALLKRLGIDPKRYWLLVDLFGQLSDHNEMMDQLGSSGASLRVMAVVYGVISALMTVGMLLVGVEPPMYLMTFLGVTGFFVLSVLLMETGNSLMNPVEAHVLAHQPINGATYVAAKLSHLVRILLYLIPTINAIPAFAALLKTVPWSYPLLHLSAAFAVGAVSALVCCAMYGWLIRLVPAKRLKSAAQLAGLVPFLAMMSQRYLHKSAAYAVTWLPESPAVRWALGVAAGAVVAVIAAMGIRALSGDYLIRVSDMMRGGPAPAARSRRLRGGSAIARLFGGQPGRAGFAFVGRMMLRDFQFRRQFLPNAVGILFGLIPPLAMARRTDPFSGGFTAMHGIPHAIAAVLFFVCLFLPFGNDYKGAWVFLTAPGPAFGGFARGVYGALCVPMIVVPHAIMLPLLAVLWGPFHTALFVAYSAAVCFLYLSLEVRLIDGPPFCRQVDPARNAASLALFILAAAIVGVALAVQYFFLFPSLARVAAATVAAGTAAWFLTRSALASFEANIRYNMSLVSADSGSLYKEVNM